MKTKIKRLTALVLTLCMLVGILPIAPGNTNAAAAPADFTINLTNAWVSGAGNYQKVQPVFDTHGWSVNQDMTVDNYYGAGNGQRVSCAAYSPRRCGILPGGFAGTGAGTGRNGPADGKPGCGAEDHPAAPGHP